MSHLTRYARGTAIGFAVLLLFGAAVGLVGAQRPDGPPRGDAPGDRGEGPFAELRGQFLSSMAQKLGVSEDALSAAFRQTMAEMRPQIQEHMQQMPGRMGDMRGHMGSWMQDHMRGMPGQMPGDMRDHPRDMMMDPPRGPRAEGEQGPRQPSAQPGLPFVPGTPREAVVGLAAGALGLQPGEMMQQLQAGKTLAEIATERGVSTDALADQITAQMEQMRVQRTREDIRQMLDRQIGEPGRDRGPAPQ